MSESKAKSLIPPKVYPTCGECEHTGLNPHHMDLLECFGAPPVPVVLGHTQGLRGPEPFIQPCRPMLPRSTRACSLFKRASAVLRMDS